LYHHRFDNEDNQTQEVFMKRVISAMAIAFVLSVVYAQTTPGFQPIKPNVIDPNRAFISPYEFTQVFGGTFEPRSFQSLFWEYNGVQLLLKKNSTAVSSLLDRKDFLLVRPVTEKENRTVVEATIIFRFNCTLAPSNPYDPEVGITCGAGETTQTMMLKRY
jgi:hypothetical protein